MEWKDLATVVAKSAPVLGAVLGGPVGAIAGAAGTVLASALNTEPTPEAVFASLKSPEALCRLKELEVQERSRILQWQETQLLAELESTQGARSREIALAKAGHSSAYLTGMVAALVVAGFFWMLQAVLTQKDINEPALLLLGSLGTAFGSVVNYYLGSSLGSFHKSNRLETSSFTTHRP